MIGFAGLGDIGAPMAHRLLDVGHALKVWNRSPDKASPLVARGATWASSPAELLESCDLVGLCLTSHQAVGEVAPAMFRAVLSSGRRTIIDLSTGSGERAQELASEAASFDIGWVDAPVSGGAAAAAEGRLTLFVGGAAADIEAAAPLLDALSARRTVLGGPGAGQTAKICNQMIVASTLLIIAETLAMARKAGLDVELLPEALRGGFADSLPLQIFGPRMAAHEFEPRLGAIGLMAKDVGLARKMAQEAGADAPVLALCAELYARAVDASADLSRIIEVFEAV